MDHLGFPDGTVRASLHLYSSAGDVDRLLVARATVDEGPTMKRIQPRAMGRAFRIRRRSSHITIVLREREEA